MGLADALPVAEAHFAIPGDVPVLQVHIAMGDGVLQGVVECDRLQRLGPIFLEAVEQTRGNDLFGGDEAVLGDCFAAEPLGILEELLPRGKGLHRFANLRICVALAVQSGKQAHLAFRALARHRRGVIAEALHVVGNITQNQYRVDCRGIVAGKVTDRSLDGVMGADVAKKHRFRRMRRH